MFFKDKFCLFIVLYSFTFLNMQTRTQCLYRINANADTDPCSKSQEPRTFPRMHQGLNKAVPEYTSHNTHSLDF